ncbi:MAG: acyl-[ACP]--phospholipid O-acyltransferase [Rickettsiales bacterium]|nr:MAG: acyl-[ACP]--phospholipid O-acyltransferase [Rickettsiales bacterium]
MESDQYYLFKDRRFLPIFIVQFCGALNDNILKNALIILITFKLANELTLSSYTLIMLAHMLFTLPFVLFASISGQLADKYERSTIVKIIKFVEIGIVIASSYGFYTTNLPILFGCIAMMGTHSTFFGPIKYSVLPDHLRKEELLGANGFIEAGTFLSILLGTMMGGFYNFSNILVISLALIVSVVGFVASLFMPKSNNFNPDVKINLNILQETVNMVKYAATKNQVYMAILGISWFWFIAATILAQIPLLTKDILGADESVASLFLVTFSVGVGVGSFLCNKIFNNTITTKYIFLATMGISVCIIDLFFASSIAAVSDEPEQLKTISEFLTRGHRWRIVIDLFLLSAISGLYVVPLYTVMQYFSARSHRSRVISANNLINSFFMMGSTITLSVLRYFDFSIPSVILFVAICNTMVAIYIYRLVPDSQIIPRKVWTFISKIIFGIMYKIEIKGLENYKKAGKKTIIIANHLSFVEPALIAVYVEEDLQFAINTAIAKEWWVKPFLKIVKTYPVEPNNPMAIKRLIEEVKKDKKIAIFPEGKITTTGSLMKVYEGCGMVADKADAAILPIRVDGTQFTSFSRVSGFLGGKFSLRRKVTITILPPVKITPPEGAVSRERRKYIRQGLYDIMSDMTFESSEYNITLFQAMINASKTYSSNLKVMHDVEHNKANYRSILIKSFILSELLCVDTKPGEKLGLMLPNMVGTAITFWGMQAAGRVPAMINFTSGSANVISSCNTAQVKILYTSKKFIEKAELESLVKAVSEAGIKVVYMENLRKRVSIGLKLKALVASMFPQRYYDSLNQDTSASSTAVILFTAGTEGRPKAVALSHKNLLANTAQALARIDFNPRDIAFNTLPMFHSFGLMASLVMSLNGIKTFFYPSPLHYRIIPEMIYDVNATILFATDTFLAGYGAHAHPYDFHTIRYVIAGAEALKERTRKLWSDKFGIRIFEGYGVTEAAPIISANTPMHNKPGTVGRLMPKIEYFLQKVDGIKEGGKLCVKGANIMQGYISPDNPGVIVPPVVEKLGEGWYDTGDIVSVDEERYITILGRQKRFAKIAGEMISLAGVESLLIKLDPEAEHAAVSIADEKKGEQIILFSTGKDITRERILQTCKQNQYSELYLPRVIIPIKEIPMMVTGKRNYRKMTEMAKKKVGE